MDTSDECEAELTMNDCVVNFQHKGDVAEAGGLKDGRYSMQTEPENAQRTQEEQLDEFIKDAERSKAHLYKVPGNNLNSFDNMGTGNGCGHIIVQIDQYYQMIDAHVDEVIRKKIQAFEYIGLNKLLTKNRSKQR